MTTPTLLDKTIRLLSDTPEETAFHAFYDQITASDLYVLLETEAKGDQVTPRLLTSDMGQFVLAFDSPERLSEFAKGIAPTLCAPGKDICMMLASTGLGLGVNVDVSHHPYLLLPETVKWIAGQLEGGPQKTAVCPTALRLPDDVSSAFLQALQLRLSGFAGAARQAILSCAVYNTGDEHLLLGFINAKDDMQTILTETVQDAVALIMPEQNVDVGFFADQDHIAMALLRNGLSLDLSDAPSYAPTAPGMDPHKPPKL